MRVVVSLPNTVDDLFMRSSATSSLFRATGGIASKNDKVRARKRQRLSRIDEVSKSTATTTITGGKEEKLVWLASSCSLYALLRFRWIVLGMASPDRNTIRTNRRGAREKWSRIVVIDDTMSYNHDDHDDDDDDDNDDNDVSATFQIFVRTKRHPNTYLPMTSTILWSQRILTLAHRRAGLTTLSAYISTLGGGYFLTRQLSVARGLARAQEQVAIDMGDVIQAAQCRLNLAYNLVQMGLYRSAYRAFVKEYRWGKARGGGGGQLIQAMARAAIIYTRKTAQLMATLMVTQKVKPGEDPDSTFLSSCSSTHDKHLHDNYYRQRPVLSRMR